jgi:hypothetical protein
MDFHVPVIVETYDWNNFNATGWQLLYLQKEISGTVCEYRLFKEKPHKQKPQFYV